MRKLLSIFFGMIVCLNSYAAEQMASKVVPEIQDAQDTTINQLLVSSGLENGLKKLPEQIIDGIKNTGLEQNFPPALHNQIINVYTESFPKDGFLIRSTDALKKNYDASRYTQVIKLLSTPLSKKVIAFESMQPTSADLQKYVNKLVTEPPSANRLELIKKLDNLMQTSSLLTKITMSNIEINAWATSDDCSNNDQIKEELESIRPIINESTQNSVYLVYAYTYRDISDAEFKEYIKIYENKHTKWVFNIINTSIEEEFKAGYKKAAQPMQLLSQSLRPPKTMFAPKCENQLVLNEFPEEKVSYSKPRSHKSNKDIRDCLLFEDSSKIIACTEGN